MAKSNEFECHLNEKEMLTLRAKLDKVLKPDEDSVRFYPLCNSCVDKADKSDFDMLAKHELDKLGIVWAQGYEEYEVSNIDLIKNQINCLNLNQN